jgi:hypothetical protein
LWCTGQYNHDNCTDEYPRKQQSDDKGRQWVVIPEWFQANHLLGDLGLLLGYFFGLRFLVLTTFTLELFLFVTPAFFVWILGTLLVVVSNLLFPSPASLLVIKLPNPYLTIVFITRKDRTVTAATDSLLTRHLAATPESTPMWFLEPTLDNYHAPS